jgi:hypothetical protein
VITSDHLPKLLDSLMNSKRVSLCKVRTWEDHYNYPEINLIISFPNVKLI